MTVIQYEFTGVSDSGRIMFLVGWLPWVYPQSLSSTEYIHLPLQVDVHYLVYQHRLITSIMLPTVPIVLISIFSSSCLIFILLHLGFSSSMVKPTLTLFIHSQLLGWKHFGELLFVCFYSFIDLFLKLNKAPQYIIRTSWLTGTKGLNNPKDSAYLIITFVLWE